ncbi:GAF and ANTAR domain-containing protein [Kribbella capetownensis]|uniref:GAF and ANTAR domain-containing protein n=1 Tax=Kribbella capetownensis TaxID=1572659 RepID=UPI001EDE8D38|nr:GAF and ANTAR domain-containing protein [Kribbella capetownensis]
MALLDPAKSFDADMFAQLAIELHDAPGVDETLETVVQFALQAENCSHAGVVLAVRGGRAEIGLVTDPILGTLYRVEIEAGACRIVRRHDRRSRRRHRPPLAARQSAAADAGIGSALHVPMTAGDRKTGVLSLYNTQSKAFTVDDEASLHILARHASVAVATARHEVAMVQAVDARKLVGQAMGILMERFDITADQAFAVLRRYSQDTNTKLRDVAHQLVDTRELPH